MDGPLALEIFEDGGVFRHGENHDEVVEKLDEALEQREAGRITPAKYLKTLKTLIEHYPHFIDGYAHLGNALMEEGKPKLALQACLRGLEVGESAIPSDFTGCAQPAPMPVQARAYTEGGHGSN